jgi:hypothetical protein
VSQNVKAAPAGHFEQLVEVAVQKHLRVGAGILQKVKIFGFTQVVKRADHQIAGETDQHICSALQIV